MKNFNINKPIIYIGYFRPSGDQHPACGSRFFTLKIRVILLN